MSRLVVALVTLASFGLLAGTPAAVAEDDPPLADCRRVLFLHWVDYSHHYVCVDQDGDVQDGECLLGYWRQAPDGSGGFCVA